MPFRLYLGARGVSILGDRIAELTIPYLVLIHTGSAFEAGVVGAANQLPAILFALWIGRAIDRRSLLTVMVGSDLARAVLFALLAVWFIWDSHQFWVLVIIVFCVGVADVWFRVAAGSFLPQIISRERLVAANGYLEAADATMTLTGPAFGGLILQALGTGAALIANAFSFIISGAFLVFIRPFTGPVVRMKVQENSHSVRSRGELLAGMRAFAKIPQMRALLLALLGLNAETSAIVLLIIALTSTQLHLSSFGIGLVLTGAGIGGLLTSTLLAPRLSRRRWGPTLGLILVIMSAAACILAFANGLITAFIANVVLDGAGALGFVVAITVRQALTPDPLQGRVTAASSLLNSVSRIASIFVAGVLITGLGQRAALVAFALMLTAVGLILAMTPSTYVPLSNLTPLAALVPDSLAIERDEKGEKQE